MSRAENFPKKEKSTTRLADLSDHKNVIFQISLKNRPRAQNRKAKVRKFRENLAKKQKKILDRKTKVRKFRENLAKKRKKKTKIK